MFLLRRIGVCKLCAFDFNQLSPITPTVHISKMVWDRHILTVIYFVVAIVASVVARDKKGKPVNEYEDKSLWKKEYEAELNDAMLSSRKRGNLTRVTQSTGRDNELVLEKLMETITTSEKYLKKVESIDFRLNRLDIEVHEKTNTIVKYLMELLKAARGQTENDRMDTVLEGLKRDMASIKSKLEKAHKIPALESVNSRDLQSDAALESRLTVLESNTKTILADVESIVSTIAEVKNRQHTRTNGKAEGGGTSEALSLISDFRRTLQEQQKSRKCECKVGRVDRSERYPTDCHEIQMQGFNVSGIYKIKPDEMEPFYVLCDLTTVGGGWTVIQNRFDGSQDFFKTWNEYKYGFGNLAGEFWLGLDKIHYLTNQKLYELRVEMETQVGQDAYAGYSVFTIGPEYEGYRISTLGTFYGTAGDSLSYHAGQKFSTPDADNDEWKDGSCAAEHGGAWWYKECDKSNLNGMYSSTPEEHRGQTMYWISFKGPNFPLTKTKMMIRPLPASRPTEFGDQTRNLMEDPVERGLPEKPMKSTRHRDQAKLRYNDPTPVDSFFGNYA